MSEDLQEETFDTLKRFFALDHDSKMDAHVQNNPAIRGYEPIGETKIDPRTRGGRQSKHQNIIGHKLIIDKDFKEAFTLGDCPLEPEQAYEQKTGEGPPSHLKRPQNIWPSSAPWFRSGIYRYYNEVLPLSLKLVRLLALGLGLDEDDFMKYFFKFPITGMRPLHYPPVPPEDKDNDVQNIGLGAHSDFSCMLD